MVWENDAVTTSRLRFRSKWPFLVVRAAGACLVPILAVVAVVETSGPAVAVTVSVFMLGIALGVIYRLLRACLIVNETEVTSYGFLRDQTFPRSLIEGAVADRTWYFSKRLLVPVTLFLLLDDGKRVHVPGVQSYVGNVGIWHVPLREEIERSYPHEVASQLNSLFSGSAASP